MTEINVPNPAFKGVYKVTMPNVDTIKDENEKNALTEAAVNSVVMGYNLSTNPPRISKDQKSVLYKIDDKNDKVFESGFNAIVADCNKQFNIDLAKKIYFEKAAEKDFNEAQPIE